MSYLSNRTKMVTIKRTRPNTEKVLVGDTLTEYWCGGDDWACSPDHPNVTMMNIARAKLHARKEKWDNVEFIKVPYSYVVVKMGDDWVAVDPLFGRFRHVELVVGYGEGYYIEGFNSEPRKLVISYGASYYTEVTFQNNKIISVVNIWGGETIEVTSLSIPDENEALRFFKFTKDYVTDV